MSRSGYNDDGEDSWASICWWGAVKSAIRGKRGQQFLRELLHALDAMPVKELIADSLVTASGAFCTLGVVGAARGIELAKLDPEDPEQVALAFGIAPAMVREIVYQNDEGNIWVNDTPPQRWQRMRQWVSENLSVPAQESNNENAN